MIGRPQPTALAISSFVARGHVGLSAIVPICQGLGVEVVALPTTLLSNHPAHVACAGEPVPPAQLAAMLDALDRNGWIAGLDAVLTGYLPSVAHVAFAADAVALVRRRNPAALVCCDPVLGDDPRGLYLPPAVATAIRDGLLPLADLITPNRFELAWLSGVAVGSTKAAKGAIASLPPPRGIVTSVPTATGGLATLAVDGHDAWQSSSARQDGIPHGTGDVLSAAVIANLLTGHDLPQALARASGLLDALIAASRGAGELQITASRGAWSNALATPLTNV